MQNFSKMVMRVFPALMLGVLQLSLNSKAAAQDEILRDWIDQGASWPEDVELVLSTEKPSVPEQEVPPAGDGTEPAKVTQEDAATDVGKTSDEQVLEVE